MPRAFVRSGVALCLIVLAIGCAPNGQDPRVRTEVYEPESGEYRLYYYAPPWELADAAGTDVLLRIPSARMSVIDGGTGRYELRASIVRGTPLALVAEEESRFRDRGYAIFAPARAVTTLEGVDGVEVIAGTADPVARSHRVVCFPVDDGRALRLAFEATPSLDTSEVDAMIRLVSLGVVP